MTREEALNKAINIVRYFEAHFAKSKEAREDMANIIEALEQEPCEDAVSRQAVKEQMIYYGFLAPDMTVTEFVEDCLPSVNPQKIGHWIADVDKWGDVVTTVNGYRCDKCNTFNADKDNYCPNCGAKMVDPQESEEEE